MGALFSFECCIGGCLQALPDDAGEAIVIRCSSKILLANVEMPCALSAMLLIIGGVELNPVCQALPPKQHGLQDSLQVYHSLSKRSRSVGIRSVGIRVM